MTIECYHCKKECTDSSVYQVKIIDEKGTTKFVPTCSYACADDLQMENYCFHSKRASEIINCSIQKFYREDYRKWNSEG